MTLTHTEMVHLAGPPVALHFRPKQEVIRIIQRCLICGSKLIEKKATRGAKGNAVFWESGQWIIEMEDGRQAAILGNSTGTLPNHTCAHGVEEDMNTEVEETESEEEEDE